MRFDAAIVGAGPAGALAARQLARSGARVVVVDGSHPREKACGGGLTARALPYAAASTETLSRAVRTAVFEAGDRTASLVMPDADVLRVFPRAALDASLLADATAAGAVHVPRRAIALERAGGAWTIRTRGDAVSARWLLGADGPSGLTRRQVFRPFARRQISIAAGAFVHDVDASEIVIRFVDRPRGYLWSFPRPGHIAVGACAQADATSTAALHTIVDGWL